LRKRIGIKKAGRICSPAGDKSRTRFRQKVQEAGPTFQNISATAIIVTIMIEVEQVEQIADRRAILRDIGIVVIHPGIREIVPAPLRQRFQVPIPLDEF
jgi:hypothetical protein